jgi:hypothetical protein
VTQERRKTRGSDRDGGKMIGQKIIGERNVKEEMGKFEINRDGEER